MRRRRTSGGMEVKRILAGPDGKTRRHANVWALDVMLDFESSPSLDTALAPPAPPPTQDCTPHS